MATGPQKNEVFGDYAAFLNALLPQAHGFMYHDRKGRMFWRDRDIADFELSKEFEPTLARVLSHGSLPSDEARLVMGRTTAFIMRLVSDRGRVLGALTAIVDRETGGMPHQFCADLLQPAIRSLQRELSLRYHLMDVNKQLKEQTTDHDFIKSLGDEARRQISFEVILDSVLDLCLDHLDVDGVTLLVPDKKLYFTAGTASIGKTEAELIYENVLESDTGSDSDIEAVFMPSNLEQDKTFRVLICQDSEPVGILLFSNEGEAVPHWEHLAGLVGFVVSTIEHVIERDFDALTGLIQWTTFEHELQEASTDTDNYYTLLFFDIDQLHLVNDTFGRAAGDQILTEFAVILKSYLEDHVVTRVTSDSFAALLKNKTVTKAAKIAEGICGELKEKGHSQDGKSFRPSVSIGVARLVPNKEGFRSALVPAQVACQAAKERGRGRVEIYQSSDTSIVRRLEDINQVGSIRNAIESDRLVLFAQPIQSLRGRDLTHYFEILVRMLNAAGDPVPPSEFMSAAERYQLMQELDKWVVRNSIQTLIKSTHSATRFAINLSGQSLGNDQFLDFVKNEIQRSGLAPNRLCFEITETVAIANLQKAQTFMNVLKDLGCHFSLDDFGTGLSSFAYLKLFPVDSLKIDGSFIRDISSNEISRSMVTAISEIARVMNLDTVAEFVQDQESVNLLRDLGVTWAQGYFIGEPRPLEAYLDGIDRDALEEIPA